MHNISTETLTEILNEHQHRPYGTVYKLMDVVIDALNNPVESKSAIIGA